MMVAITVYPILWRSRKFIDKVCYTGLGLILSALPARERAENVFDFCNFE